MAERDDDDCKEGWEVPFRIGAISGVLTALALGLLVLGCGVAYDHGLRPRLAYRVTPQPAPGLATDIHAGARDPEIARPRGEPDASIDRAKREIVADGLPGWGAKPR